MAVLLRPGQGLRRPADLAIVDYDVSGGVAVSAVASPGMRGADVRTPVPGRIVIARLQDEVVLTASATSPGARVEAGRGLLLNVVLRRPGGQEEISTTRIDLGGTIAQDVLKLARTAEGDWEVTLLESASNVVLDSALATAAFAAARDGVAANAARPRSRMLALDTSASMSSALLDGSVQDVLDVLSGVYAHQRDTTTLPVVCYAGGAWTTSSPLEPGHAGGYVREHIAGSAPGSGSAMSQVIDMAARAGHRTLIAVTDGTPPDLDRIRSALSDNPRLQVVVVALADSARAADPGDRLGPEGAWREELAALDDVHPSLAVVSVPPGQRLTPERAEHLARAVVELEGTAP